MLINTQESLNAKDLIPLLVPSDSSGGKLVLQQARNKKLEKTKVPADQVEWFLDRTVGLPFTSISSAAYQGKSILPNFSATKTISVRLSLEGQRYRTSEELHTALRTACANAHVPQPSAVVVTQKIALPLWIVDTPFDTAALANLYILEHGLTVALKSLGSSPNLRSASQLVPLPRIAFQNGIPPVALLSAGSIREISLSRLSESVRPFVDFHAAETICRNCQVVEELGELLLSRILFISPDSHRYWLWLAGYAAACGLFVEPLEIREIVRSVIESINCEWASAKDQRIPFLGIKHETYLDIIVQNTRSQCVAFGDFFNLNDAHWPRVLAHLLAVTPQEVDELSLLRLVPPNCVASNASKLRQRNRIRLGREDYISLSEFIGAA